jgi:hypothetical protein
METLEQTEIEQIDTSQVAPDVEISVGSTVNGGEALQDALGDIADSFGATGFKCVKCGLAHMHDTTKHRLSDSFDVSPSEAASNEYNPTCHCGVQEAGRHGSDYGVDETEAASVASSAPIPAETRRELDEAFGHL